MESATAIKIEIIGDCNPLIEKAKSVFERQIAKRCGPFTVFHLTEERTPFIVGLSLDGNLKQESFRIEDEGFGRIRILGGDERGLLFGIGKFLHSSKYDTGRLTPSQWRGVSWPQKKIRGMYLATHFHNWLQEAPIEDVSEYIEEIALWGINAIGFWYSMHEGEGAESPSSLALVSRLKAIGNCAKSMGLDVYNLIMANEGFSDTPENLRAERSTDGMYHTRPVAWFDGQICPSKPDGKKLILENRRKMLDLFADFEFDGFIIWPYDQGGCTCGKCAPWGSNGYLRLAPEIVEQIRNLYPEIKIILSLWEFNSFVDGEYEGLAESFKNNPPKWIDYLMADGHNGETPGYIRENGIPGNLPLLGFPEISMWKTEPWGGYGAVCNPAAMQKLWDASGNLCQGGFPYSEGRFEDVNKVIASQFYWSGQSAQDTLMEYAAFEFSAEFAEEIANAINLLEKSFPRALTGKKLPLSITINDPQSAERAWTIISKIDNSLSPRVRRSWRWRLIFLRSLIDHEIVTNGPQISLSAEEALNELTELYCFKPYSHYCLDPQRLVRHCKQMSRRSPKSE